MFRFLKFWIRPDYEECKGCQISKYQLEQANLEKKELLELIISLVRPQPVMVEPKSAEAKQLILRNTTFSRRRAMLEERDRIEAQRIKNSPFSAKPDDNEKARQEAVDALEKEVNSLEREVIPDAG